MYTDSDKCATNFLWQAKSDKIKWRRARKKGNLNHTHTRTHTWPTCSFRHYISHWHMQILVLLLMLLVYTATASQWACLFARPLRLARKPNWRFWVTTVRRKFGHSWRKPKKKRNWMCILMRLLYSSGSLYLYGLIEMLL